MLDLHTHSTASDGQLTPTELVRRAKCVGLTGIGLTDHDTLAGLAEAQRVATTLGLKMMPGVEISAEWRDKDVHILGYFVEDRGPLVEIMHRAREARVERTKAMIGKLNALGIDISFADVTNAADDGIGSLGRPHIARVLVSLGVVQDVPQAFARYLERGKPAFVPRFKLSPNEAVQAITASKGVAVWAHPGNLGGILIQELIIAGLKGIEVFHPIHSPKEEKRLTELAICHQLTVTGGSDAHDATTVGIRSVDDAVWDKILLRKP